MKKRKVILLFSDQEGTILKESDGNFDPETMYGFLSQLHKLQQLTGADVQMHLVSPVFQKQMQEAQKEIEAAEFEASVGGGAVSVKVNGKKEVLAVSIKPEVVDEDDVEMLEDLVLSAVNEALRKADEDTANKMGKLTGGMNMPGLF